MPRDARGDAVGGGKHGAPRITRVSEQAAPQRRHVPILAQGARSSSPCASARTPAVVPPSCPFLSSPHGTAAAAERSSHPHRSRMTNCWQSAHIMPPSAQKTRRCMVCVDVGVSTVGLDYLGRLPLAEQALRQMASTSHRAPIIASTHIDQDQSTITCSRPSYSPRGCSWGCRGGGKARASDDHSGSDEYIHLMFMGLK